MAPAASTSRRSERSEVTTVASRNVDHDLTDQVVSRVATAPGCVAHRNAPVLALRQVRLCYVQHERGRLAEALQTAEQSSHGRWSVTPPAVGGRADHVVAVDHEDLRSVACPAGAIFDAP